MVDPNASLGTELNRLADAASDGTLDRSFNEALALDRACRRVTNRTRPIQADGSATAALGPPLLRVLAAWPATSSDAESKFGIASRTKSARRCALKGLQQLGASSLLTELASVDRGVDDIVLVLQAILAESTDELLQNRAIQFLGEVALASPGEFAEATTVTAIFDLFEDHPVSVHYLRVVGVLACERRTLPASEHLRSRLKSATTRDDPVERVWARLATSAASDDHGPPDPTAVAAELADNPETGVMNDSRYAAVEELAFAGYVDHIDHLPCPTVRQKVTDDALSERLSGAERLIVNMNTRRSEPPPGSYKRTAVSICADALEAEGADLRLRALHDLARVTTGGSAVIPVDDFPAAALLDLIGSQPDPERQRAIRLVGELASSTSRPVFEGHEEQLSVPIDAFVDALLTPGDAARQAKMTLIQLADRDILTSSTALPLGRLLDGITEGVGQVRTAVVETLNRLVTAGVVGSPPVEYYHAKSDTTNRSFGAWLVWLVETFRDNRASAGAKLLAAYQHPGACGGDAAGKALDVELDDRYVDDLPTGALEHLAGTGVLAGHIDDILSGIRSRFDAERRADRVDAADRLAAVAQSGQLAATHSLPLESLCALIEEEREPIVDPLADDRRPRTDPGTVVACDALSAVASTGVVTDPSSVDLAVTSALDVLESGPYLCRTDAARTLRELARFDQLDLERLTDAMEQTRPPIEPGLDVGKYLPDSRDHPGLRHFFAAIEETLERPPAAEVVSIDGLREPLNRYLLDVDPDADNRVAVMSLLSRLSTPASRRI